MMHISITSSILGIIKDVLGEVKGVGGGGGGREGGMIHHFSRYVLCEQCMGEI